MAEYPLRPLSSITTAIRDGTHGTHPRVRDGVPLLSAKNISEAGSIVWSDSDDRISEAEYRQIHSSFRLEPKDLLLTIVGTLGRRAIYEGQRVTFQRSVAYLRPDTNRVSTRFLFHWFAHPRFTRELQRRSNATAQAGLYLGELAQVVAPDCPRELQDAIAAILDTLDGAINQTEAIIEKLKQVKQGLLHDLMTRGIDENGELRPPHSQEPHLYKQSSLGWIPNDWSAGLLEQWLLSPPKNGYSPREAEERAGFLMLGLGCLTSRGFEPIQLKNAPANDARVLAAQVRDGDLLMSRANTRDLVGMAGVFRDFGFPCIYPDLMMRLTPTAATSSEFLEYVLRSHRVRRQIQAEAVGTSESMVKISGRTVKRLWVAIPDCDEQGHILDRARTAARAIAEERSLASKLRWFRLGLVDDLLTGRVRVTRLLKP